MQYKGRVVVLDVLPLMAYISYLIVSSVEAREIIDVIYFTLHFIGLLALLFLLQAWMGRWFDSWKIVFDAMLLLIVVGGLVAIYCLVFPLDTIWIFGLPIQQNLWTFPRVHGFFGEPTSMGALLGLFVILLFGQRNLMRKSSWLATFLLCVALLVLTGSRNAIASLSITFLAYCFIHQKLRKADIRMVFVALGFLLTFSILIAVYFPEIVDTAWFLLDRGITTENKNSRVLIWGNVVAMISDFDIRTLLFGMGHGALRAEYRAGFNQILENIYNVGLLGVVLYIWVFASLFLKALKRADRICLFILVYLFAFNLFISWFPRDTFNAVTIGLSICVWKLNNKRGVIR